MRDSTASVASSVVSSSSAQQQQQHTGAGGKSKNSQGSSDATGRSRVIAKKLGSKEAAALKAQEAEEDAARSAKLGEVWERTSSGEVRKGTISEVGKVLIKENVFHKQKSDFLSLIYTPLLLSSTCQNTRLKISTLQ